MSSKLDRSSSISKSSSRSSISKSSSKWDLVIAKKVLAGPVGLDTEGLNGFEELRKYIKQGNEFCKEVYSIMQERSDVEFAYAKSLSKLSSRLQKAAGTCVGTMATAWLSVTTEMEEEAELHRNVAQALMQDIAVPLKELAEQIHKQRKPIEQTVEKTVKKLIDSRNDEQKQKKNSFSHTKEIEKLFRNIQDAKAGKIKMNEKEISKTEKKSRSMDQQAQKVDKDYHDAWLKAECCRQEWEMAVTKASGQLQSLEEDRVSNLHELLHKYSSHLSVIGPRRIKCIDRMEENIMTVDIGADLRSVIEQKGTGVVQPEQLLYESFAEDQNNSMNKDRRLHCLRTYLYFIGQDIEREKKSKDGINKLLAFYAERAEMAKDPQVIEDTKAKLQSTNSMLNFLHATHHKLSCGIATISGQPKPQHVLSQYMEFTKDKQGLPQSLLRLPPALNTSDIDDYNLSPTGDRPPVLGENQNTYEAPVTLRQRVSSQYDDDFFEEGFESIYRPPSYTNDRVSISSYPGSSSAISQPVGPPPAYTERDTNPSTYAPPEAAQGHNERAVDVGDHYDAVMDNPNGIIGTCRALYDYTATQNDELSLREGDLLHLLHKQDEWWYGENNGQQGYFPSSYVEMV